MQKGSPDVRLPFEIAKDDDHAAWSDLLTNVLFGSGFTEAVAESFNTTAHVVHRFLCAGIKRM